MFVPRCSALVMIALLGLAVASPAETAPKNSIVSDVKDQTACTYEQAGPLWKKGTYKKQVIHQTIPNGKINNFFSVPSVCDPNKYTGSKHIATVVSACDATGYPPVVVLDSSINGGIVHHSGLSNSPIELTISVYCRAITAKDEEDTQ